MKIVGFSQISGEVKMVLKCDSSLLVNRKPFFIPDWSEDIRMTPCVAIRVSRLGKNIGTRFASRYYDAVAPAVNICAVDALTGGDEVKAWAFDYSMPMGQFVPLTEWQTAPTILSLDEAVHRVSELMTIRQGDVIFVDCDVPARALVKEEVISVVAQEKELLYCKVK